MRWIFRQDEYYESTDCTSTKMAIFIAQVYLMTLTYVVMFFFCLHNLLKYVIKERRYKNLPLLFSYILAMLVTLMRICYFTFYYHFFFDIGFIFNFMPAILKLSIGILQGWIMIELAMNMDIACYYQRFL